MHRKPGARRLMGLSTYPYRLPKGFLLKGVRASFNKGYHWATRLSRTGLFTTQRIIISLSGLMSVAPVVSMRRNSSYE